jgi:ferredoxin
MQFATGVRPAIAPFGRTSPRVGSSRLVCVFLRFLVPKIMASGDGDGDGASVGTGTAASARSLPLAQFKHPVHLQWSYEKNGYVSATRLGDERASERGREGERERGREGAKEREIKESVIEHNNIHHKARQPGSTHNTSCRSGFSCSCIHACVPESPFRRHPGTHSSRQSCP